MNVLTFQGKAQHARSSAWAPYLMLSVTKKSTKEKPFKGKHKDLSVYTDTL